MCGDDECVEGVMVVWVWRGLVVCVWSRVGNVCVEG